MTEDLFIFEPSWFGSAALGTIAVAATLGTLSCQVPYGRCLTRLCITSVYVPADPLAQQQRGGMTACVASCHWLHKPRHTNLACISLQTRKERRAGSQSREPDSWLTQIQSSANQQ